MEIPLELIDKLFDILNILVRKAESFGLKDNKVLDKSLGVFLYENYLETVKKELQNKFVNEFPNQNDFKKIIDGFFIWRFNQKTFDSFCDFLFKNC